MGAGAAAAAAAAIARAIKASGAIVELEPEEFQRVLYNARELVIVMSPPRRFHKTYDYITSYRGLAFATRAPSPLHLPSGSELIAAKKIWLPD
jgi:hypothetical protein